ncbi:hypothetical protein FACS1894187_14140 [Synergistales bacterium]|nr:hypothetical protein FACS1894187_14140 [Synergistales bacterium]
MTELKEKYKAALIFAAGMACFLVAGLMVRALPRVADTAPAAEIRAQTEIRAEAKAEPEIQTQELPREAPVEWFLYITGHVRKPGVYKLPENSRLFQLVEAAGGLTGFADPDAVNLAAPLADGVHVYVPRKGEKKEQEDPWAAQAQNGQTTIVIEAPSQSSSRNYNLQNNSQNKLNVVDVNRATAEELASLKGIGPSLAKRIIDYRQSHGRFKRVEDLLNVTGIGVKKLEDFRNSVTIRP